MQVGAVPGNARATFQAALNESFKQIDYVVTKYVVPAQMVPLISTSAAATTYVTSILTDYDAQLQLQMQLLICRKLPFRLIRSWNQL